MKPIQEEIRTSHFSRATLYALLANCLQFRKEGQTNPAIVGVCNTRALLAELLAVRLLKDFNTRELIDALSYDFDPLSGGPQPIGAANGRGRPATMTLPKKPPTIARTSTLEVAIRAEAKKFLSHPLVVQQLEAIWAGSIVFHSAADNLHRYPSRPRITHERHYGATYASPNEGARPKPNLISTPSPAAPSEPIRRSVSLYDPRSASLFKLSRLRVPRYRQLMSTLSYGVMLGLFIAVLSERSVGLTALEVLFWFWSLGFMLDELVGFSEQGFGLYIASVWNAFDIGILFLFTIYYLLRVVGAVVTHDYKQRMAYMAYDVLASSAVLLFPRLFSLLDHFRYFSQLLIAFRLMAQDLVAVLLLITICCSGFFVAFTMSFGQEDFAGRGVAYALFQILMGFSPAAWEVWDDFNSLGKTIMAVFLIIGHFLIVTILITVLTNSFMAIVKNANEEHQYLFAINTISAVKSDALFSYVAPSNIIGFGLTPLRYLMPFPKFVVVNRTVIKATHFPMLFGIFAYEKIRMAASGAEPVAYIEQRGPSSQRVPTFALQGGSDPYANTHKIRWPSEAAWHKDRALDEVFRRPFDRESTHRKPKPQPSMERRKRDVDQWINVVGDQGGASPPSEQPRSILEELETSRPKLFRSKTSQALNTRAHSMAPSFTSDPEERRRSSRPARPHSMQNSDLLGFSMDEPAEAADDELNSNDDGHDHGTLQHDSDKENRSQRVLRPRSPSIQFSNQAPPSSVVRHRFVGSSPGPTTSSPPVSQTKGKRHDRQSSTQTILFNPKPDGSTASSPPLHSPTKPSRRRMSRPGTALKTIPSASHSPQMELSDASRPPEKTINARPRPAMPTNYSSRNKSTPNLLGPMQVGNALREPRAPSYDAMALDLASDIGDNRYVDPPVGVLASSFQTQMMRGMEFGGRRNQAQQGEDHIRLLLAQMNNMNTEMKGLMKEVKELRNAGSRGGSTAEDTTKASKHRRVRSRQIKVAPEDEIEHSKTEPTAPAQGQGKENDVNAGGAAANVVEHT